MKNQEDRSLMENLVPGCTSPGQAAIIFVPQRLDRMVWSLALLLLFFCRGCRPNLDASPVQSNELTSGAVSYPNRSRPGCVLNGHHLVDCQCCFYKIRPHTECEFHLLLFVVVIVVVVVVDVVIVRLLWWHYCCSQ